jgi:hypothetical protein
VLLTLFQISLISTTSGLLYGLALIWRAHSYLIYIIAKTLILTSFIVYLLNLDQLLFILVALLIFLITFWLTILKLERF